ncbi:translation initiation factor IF-2 [Candidatus Falkowbacteria bacterium CG_4_10_14_0_2_um_filter_41_15]|uniref:Translation initiation factor IF-2 n=3 Tax=Candidatus Falkowiibacteriota TaxID=1752728 RepID=A0A2G9ZMD1_9BACT|nr:MAG: translation initiation factor IF-2 [Candidatus Falkowbacteria bacterium CG1_02_41_21]PIP34312.1 MAG: translation initiation factor IF-2 [Candidatus Falkowbacteria bacterium CG23_combo_of_CG06-09_8_20_14_all_41_10]PJA09995.1 MAG: translation initiation factor IF-2 [Candidatus Falkowbacteria bacterium CG_4_10_14_0_2_um_filter_41_15]
MNVTELARILRINPQDLKDLLPQMGFNIGQKAIKVDNHTARRIIKEWPALMHQIELKRAAEDKEREAEAADVEIIKKEINIPPFITVRDFASRTELPISKVLGELMKNGIFVSMNERIDFDTAAIIGADLNLDVKALPAKDEMADVKEEKRLDQILRKENKKEMSGRSPVIVVMGHVDHGKTKLLDAIRTTNVVEGEAGGITQHIGAYQVRHHDQSITFIDTPGHEAFTAMRSRGAKVADIAILVVAADEGVKPQTVEAFRIIEAAKIPYVLAINKIDKPGADINKTKQELSTQLNINPEDWGGKAICVPVSAKEGKGINELLDMLLLVAETEADNLKANPGAGAVGTVIEAKVDKGAGPVATILVQNGTLRVGDQLCFNNVIYGKVKALKNYKGEIIAAAGPSTPVRILGLKILPEVGDMLEVGEGEKIKIKKIASANSAINKAVTAKEDADDQAAKLNLIIKSDVLGSAEAIEESLMKLNNNKVRVKILSKGLGNISEGDVKRAEDSGAQIVGFNVKIQPQTEILLREKQISVNLYTIIYDLIKDIKGQMQEMVKADLVRKDLGRLKVLVVFRTEKGFQILGGKVLDGQIVNDTLVEVLRDKDIIAKGKLVRLQSGKQNVKTVAQDQECGLQYEGSPVVQAGDVLNVYTEEEIINKM